MSILLGTYQGVQNIGFSSKELTLESKVLESDVRNWFWNHKSWNQMSRIGFGIISLGIKCPELDLESQVLESNVRN